MRPTFSLAFLLLAATTIAGAQSSSATLEERMSQAEFNAAGLGKLSPQELQQLNGWLDAHGGSTEKVVTSNGHPLFYLNDSERQPIEQHIAGNFTGWRGRTVFKLDNGQEWQQAESGMFDGGNVANPAVRIKPMLLGSWLMYVEGCGCNLRVKRIK